MRRGETLTSRSYNTSRRLPAALGEVLAFAQLRDTDTHHRLTQTTGDLRNHSRVVEERRRLDDGLGALRGVARLEDARAHEHALGAELHHHRRVGGGRDTTGDEHHHGQLARLGDLLDQLVRGLQLFRRDIQLVLAHRRQPADLAADLAHVHGRVGDVTGPGLALGSDHCRTLADPAKGLAQVGRAADERNRELPLVDVVRVVRRGQHLGLVDVVHAQALQHLRLDEVTDPGLGHDRDGDSLDDPLHHVRVAHPGDPALGTDVGRHALKSHHRNRAGVLGYLGLLGGDDVHDDAALEHLGHAPLDARGTGGWNVGGGLLRRQDSASSRGRTWFGGYRPILGRHRPRTSIGSSSSISKVCGSSAWPARRSRRTPGLRRTRRTSVTASLRKRRASSTRWLAAATRWSTGAPTASSSRSRRRVSSPRASSRAWVRSLSMASRDPRSVVSASRESVAAPARIRALDASSAPQFASSRVASARRTSWASRTLSAPSTRVCNRSSRAAPYDTYQAMTTASAIAPTIQLRSIRSLLDFFRHVAAAPSVSRARCRCAPMTRRRQPSRRRPARPRRPRTSRTRSRASDRQLPALLVWRGRAAGPRLPSPGPRGPRCGTSHRRPHLAVPWRRPAGCWPGRSPGRSTPRSG